MGSPFSRDSVEEGAAFPDSGTWLQALSSEELFLLGLLQALYGSLRLLKAEKHICSMCIYLKCQPFAPLPPSFFKACIHILRSRNTLPRYTLPQLLCSCSVEQQGCCREHCWSWGGRLHRRGSEFGQGCREVLLPSSWEKSSELGSPSGVGNLPSACWFPLISHVKRVRMQKWCVASRHSPVPAADFADFSDSTVCFGSVLTFRWGPSTTR